MPQVSHAWRPIEGLTDPAAIAAPEMRAFTKLWQRQRQNLQELEVLELFQERLARQWSIETGVIERLYDLSRGLTVTLIERGFHASLVAHGDATMEGERLIEILEDHREGLAMVMDLVGGTRPLSPGWIKELHALLTRHQHTTDAVTPTGQRTQVKLLRGAFKQRPNNPLRPDGLFHEYCPPEHVQSEMDRLIEIYHALPSELPEVRAAWLHHRFTQIHPFQDGNGRVARGLASVEFIRAGLLPLLIEREDRDTHYFPALEAADAGDLQPLVAFFADSMSRVLMRASAEAELVMRGKRDVGNVLRAARKKVQARARPGSSLAQETRRLDTLTIAIRRRFEDLREQILGEFPEIQPRVVTPTQPSETRLFHNQILELAQRHSYGISISAPRTWVRLTLPAEDTRTEIVVSIHGLSGPSAGTWALDVLVSNQSSANDEPRVFYLDVEPLLLTSDEEEEAQLERVDAWIEQMKVQAVAQWVQFL